MEKKKDIDPQEAIRNLLIISLLRQGIAPKIIEKATGMAEKTIRNKFPVGLLGKKMAKSETE